MSEMNNDAPASSSVSESQESSQESQSVESSAAPEGSLESASQEQLEAASQDPSLSKEQKKEVERQLKKFQIKVDGNIEDVELDLSNEEEIKKHLQLSKAAQRRMQEASEVRKAAEQLVDLLRRDPKRVLSDPNININLKEFAQQIIQEQLEEEQKSPEQREIEKLRRELEEIQNMKKKEEEEFKQREFDRLQSEAERDIESDITEALNSSGLPKTPKTVKMMAEQMLLAHQNNIDLKAKDVVSLIRKQLQDEVKQLFSVASDDVLEELLDQNVQSRLQKRRVAKAKAAVQTANSVKSTGAEVKPKEDSSGKKLSMKDFFGI